MAFLEDPRLRQRWNTFSHNAEAVTSDAAAGIWTFQHRYINPCLSSLAASIDSCTAPCIGDREERARRIRERARGARPTRAEYSFDFYHDWDEADDELEDGEGTAGMGSGLLKGWGSEDWDQLLAGTGSGRSRGGASGIVGVVGGVSEQPKRKRAMSYGTRGVRRKSNEEDPTVIPSTAPLGFLERLPWKLGGTLRYKPSAANLQDNPGTAMHEHGEREPLLGASDDETGVGLQPSRYLESQTSTSRKRSSTTASGDTTSDSFRSRNDLFPSDGEGDEDAIPLDDEFAVALDRVHDDRSASSGKTRTSKGKRPEGSKMSRTTSRTTIGSNPSRPSLRTNNSSNSMHSRDAAIMSPAPPALADLHAEEERLGREEDVAVERRRIAATQLAAEKGLVSHEEAADLVAEAKSQAVQAEIKAEPGTKQVATPAQLDRTAVPPPQHQEPLGPRHEARLPAEELQPGNEDDEFIGARLPNFR